MTENENLMEENLMAQVETEPEAIEPEESTTGEAIESEDNDADESDEECDEILEMQRTLTSFRQKLLVELMEECLDENRSCDGKHYDPELLCGFSSRGTLS